MNSRDDIDAMAAERSWSEYRRLVLDGLERIDRRLTQIDTKIDQEISLIDSKVDRESALQRQEISDLKVQVGQLRVWATLSGAIAAAIVTAFVQFVFRK